MPFRMAITTNYDRLLESSYPNSQRTVLTWKDATAVLRALQLNRFVVLKTHGAIGDGPSLILSTRQYRNLIYANPLFWQVLKWIFMTKTCLFVGASLQDSDLSQLFHEAITECGQSFGPHYALLPETEAPDIRTANLLHSLRIRVIRLRKPDDRLDENQLSPEKRNEEGKERTEATVAAPCLKKSIEWSEDRWKAEAASRVLVALSGEVARRWIDIKPPMLPTSNDHGFYLRKALGELLESALKVTGSFRGDICLLQDGMGGHLSGKLYYVVSRGPTAHEIEGTNLEVPDKSVCNFAYHQPTYKEVYVRNIHNPRLEG